MWWQPCPTTRGAGIEAGSGSGSTWQLAVQARWCKEVVAAVKPTRRRRRDPSRGGESQRCEGTSTRYQNRARS